jgi:hypothetical protein
VSAAAAQAQPDPDPPQANPARPTFTNPATLPPVGYLQFEQGYLGSLHSPDTTSQYGANQVTKLAVHPRLMFQIQLQPFAASLAAGDTTYTRGSGDVLLGTQLVLFPRPDGKPRLPSVAIGYLGRIHTGTTGDTDLGSFAHSLVLLVSGDLGGFHYDSNYLVNDQPGSNAQGNTIRRAQFGQTLSVNHALFLKNLQLAVELYHLSQPLVTVTDNATPVRRANLVDLLLAPSLTVRPNLVLDCGFSRGLTNTSTRWQSFAGFTYLLPYRLWPARKS